MEIHGGTGRAIEGSGPAGRIRQAAWLDSEDYFRLNLFHLEAQNLGLDIEANIRQQEMAVYIHPGELARAWPDGNTVNSVPRLVLLDKAPAPLFLLIAGIRAAILESAGISADTAGHVFPVAASLPLGR